MLREENEGYSKLITELNQETMGISPSQFVGNLKSLVGELSVNAFWVCYSVYIMTIPQAYQKCNSPAPQFTLDFFSRKVQLRPQPSDRHTTRSDRMPVTKQKVPHRSNARIWSR